MQKKFKAGLEELVHLCHEGGMHSDDMIEPLRYWLKWAEEIRAREDRDRLEQVKETRAREQRDRRSQ
jgi:hypothetical protein